jgi:hypothetical protein
MKKKAPKKIKVIVNEKARFLIARDNRQRTKYLEGFDGQDCGWTWTSRTGAWPLSNHTGQADRLLASLRPRYPKACIVPVSQAELSRR